MERLFPSGLAEGKAFCNRVTEKAQLQRNIESIVHTLIISPRRYGKTSLIVEVLRSSKMPYASIQFFNAFRGDVVVKRFLKGFSTLLSQIITPSSRALRTIGQLLSHGKLVLKTQGLAAEFAIEPIGNDPIEVIQGMLQDIQHILKSQKKRAVVFLDEFQDIINSDLSNELQSILRDFIQTTNCITFVVSGSHQHMLAKLFDDSSKPFYKLFERIILKRIDAKHYEDFLNKLAIGRWRKKPLQESISAILQLSECHAYYLNRLCHKLWALNQVPEINEIYQCWEMLVEEEFGTVAMELSTLTKNQRIVLQSIAKYKFVKQPTGTEFISEVKLPSRSVQIAIIALEKIAFVEWVDNGYQVIDPLMKYVLLH